MNKNSEVRGSSGEKAGGKEMVEIFKMWEKYLDNKEKNNEQEVKMGKLKNRVNDLRAKAAPNRNQQLIRREQDNLKSLKLQLDRLRQQKETLLKLQSKNNHTPPSFIDQQIIMKHSIGISDKIKSLKMQNRQLLEELKQKQKIFNKQHIDYFNKCLQDRQSSYNPSFLTQQTKNNISSLNQEIEQVSRLKSQTQQSLKKQLEQVDLSYNKIKGIVDKKQMIYEEKMKELAKLRARMEGRERVRLSLEKQRDRERVREKLNERRKSISLRKRGEQEGKNGEMREEVDGEIDRNSGYNRDKSREGEYLNSVPNNNERQSRQVLEQLGRISRIIKNKQLKNYNSIGVGTTFYYNNDEE